MAPFFFGFEPRPRGATKQVVKTSAGELEPVEPSRFKVYASSLYNPLYSLMVGILGLVVAVLSYPAGHFAHVSIEGVMTKSAGDNYLPFECPGLALVVAKGKVLRQIDCDKLESLGFVSIQMAGRKVWVKSKGSREDYLAVRDIPDIDPAGIVPGRHLNLSAFEAFLILRSFTTRICELFHILAESGTPYAVAKQRDDSKPKDSKWINLRTLSSEVPMVDGEFEFADPKIYELKNSNDGRISSFLKMATSNLGISVHNSGVVVSPSSPRPAGILSIGGGSKIKSHGLLMKFDPRLACPDVNYIGDVIGRRFLKGLGGSIDEQLENLQLLKSGLSALSLTRVGDELAHLYRCLDIAIDCNAGLVPIFHRSRYEGALIAGGPGAELIHNGKRILFQSVTTLKNEFLTFSDHASNLTAILSILKYQGEEGESTIPETMFDLRRMCLESSVSQSERDEIIRRAANLDFCVDTWVVNPANLKAAFHLIANFSNLDETYPIGRLSLFSNDPVLVALSCFGEKSCPSWDIPNGTPCSLAKAIPPSPPATNISRRGGQGVISDAAWVMVVRQTDLLSGVEEFRSMAATLTYRSSASQLARKVGHRVFSRERMNEFWGTMREALRSVNPNARFEEEGSSSKRARESTETLAPESQPKRRRMDI